MKTVWSIFLTCSFASALSTIWRISPFLAMRLNFSRWRLIQLVPFLLRVMCIFKFSVPALCFLRAIFLSNHCRMFPHRWVLPLLFLSQWLSFIIVITWLIFRIISLLFLLLRLPFATIITLFFLFLSLLSASSAWTCCFFLLFRSPSALTETLTLNQFIISFHNITSSSYSSSSTSIILLLRDWEGWDPSHLVHSCPAFAASTTPWDSKSIDIKFEKPLESIVIHQLAVITSGY